MNAIFNEFLKGNANYCEVRLKIMESIPFLGGIRWYNDAYNLELNFKGISLHNIFTSEPINLDKEIAIEEINDRSPNKQRTVTLQEIENFLPSEFDLFNICNGHDFEKALASYITNHSKAGVKPKEIGKSLRLSYNIEDFKQTKLFGQLSGWEKRYSLPLFNYGTDDINN